MHFNLADLFESLADALPDRPALISGTVRHSYADLDRRANRLANFLRDRGVGAGDHVGLHLYNGHEYVEGMLAAFKLRAVPINLNYRYVADELAYLVNNADLVAVISQRELGPIIHEASADSELVKTLLLVGESEQANLPDDLDHIDYEAALASASDARDFPERSGDDLYIIYTGGTTGMPKGVMWRQKDVFFAGLQGGNPGGEPISRPEMLVDVAKEGGMIFLPTAPFIHGAAQWGALIGMFSGAPVVLQPGKSFDAKRVCELVGEEGVQTITLVGDAMARPIVDALEADPGKYNMESLFVIASAGAVLSPSVRQRLLELLPDRLVLNSFGASETGHQGSAMPGEETGQEGRPSFMMDETNTVLDENNQPIAPGSGKIGRLARSGRVPIGYYKDPQKTAERFVTIDGVRWSIPGDSATIEADGRITVYGRGSNCINTGGEKVFPEEVEEALKSHPEVYDCLVVGVADDRWMQRVSAVVEPFAGKSPSLSELQAHCRRRIAGYKVPRELTLVDKVVRMPSGKPDYKWAQKMVEANLRAAAE